MSKSSVPNLYVYMVVDVVQCCYYIHLWTMFDSTHLSTSRQTTSLEISTNNIRVHFLFMTRLTHLLFTFLPLHVGFKFKHGDSGDPIAEKTARATTLHWLCLVTRLRQAPRAKPRSNSHPKGKAQTNIIL